MSVWMILYVVAMTFLCLCILWESIGIDRDIKKRRRYR